MARDKGQCGPRLPVNGLLAEISLMIPSRVGKGWRAEESSGQLRSCPRKIVTRRVSWSPCREEAEAP